MEADMTCDRDAGLGASVDDYASDDSGSAVASESPGGFDATERSKS
jgi:hypothetical protein